MSESDPPSWFDVWEGYDVATTERRDGDAPEIWIFIGRRPTDRSCATGAVVAFFGLRWDAVKAVGMEMSVAYANEVRAHRPNVVA